MQTRHPSVAHSPHIDEINTCRRSAFVIQGQVAQDSVEGELSVSRGKLGPKVYDELFMEMFSIRSG